ncbi:MAG: tellurite resistance TerB family protein [Polyangiaceae bacterium]
MQTEARIQLFARLAQSSPRRVSEASRPSAGSILSLAATSYGARPVGDATIPTGFDPAAIALFEAIVEGAYVIANADGVFDAQERRVFERVVIAACDGTVAPNQIEAMVRALERMLKEDGLDRRIDVIAQSLKKKDHAREVLRVAALLAHVSDAVSAVERAALQTLASRCGLDAGEVDAAIARAADGLGE